MPLIRHAFNASTARFTSSAFVQEQIRNASAQRQWRETDFKIPVRDGSVIEARVYNPEARPGSADIASALPNEHLPPALVLIHGGGLCMGDLGTEAFLCRYLCASLNIVVVNVGYRLYPEVGFPTPILDTYDAMKWVSVGSRNCT